MSNVDPELLNALDHKNLQASRDEWRALAVKLYGEKEAAIADVVDRYEVLVNAWAKVAVNASERKFRQAVSRKTDDLNKANAIKKSAAAARLASDLAAAKSGNARRGSK